MRHDPFDLKQQEAIKEERLLQEKIDRENEESDLKWLCSSKRGRRVVWRLLEQSGVFHLSFDPNALKMAFNEGNRNFGNRTLAMIQSVCPEHYLTMTKEYNERRDSDARKQQRGRDADEL